MGSSLFTLINGKFSLRQASSLTLTPRATDGYGHLCRQRQLAGCARLERDQGAQLDDVQSGYLLVVDRNARAVRGEPFDARRHPILPTACYT